MHTDDIGLLMAGMHDQQYPRIEEQNRFDEGRARLGRIAALACTQDTAFYERAVGLLRRVVSPGAEQPWRKNGQPHHTNEAAVTLAADQRYPKAYVRAQLRWVDDRLGSSFLKSELSYLTTELYQNVIGMPNRAVRQLPYTFDLRMHDYTLPTRTQDGSYELRPDRWKQSLEAVCDQVQAIGPEQARKVYEECNISNFDSLSRAQLERMVAYANGDEGLLERLRTNNMSVVLMDTVEDKGNATARFAQIYDEEDTLFFEVTNPYHMYGHNVRLTQQHGIRPCKLVLAHHGSPLDMSVAKSYFHDKGYALMSAASAAWKGRYGFMDLRKSQAGRFMHEYMQPHSQTGNRTVVAGACFAGRTPLFNRYWPYLRRSVAGGIANQAYIDDRVEVIASPQANHPYAGEDGHVRPRHKSGRNVPILAFQHTYDVPLLGVTSRRVDHIPPLRPRRDDPH